jgi:hypothetical protein
MQVDDLLAAVVELVGDLVEPTHSNGRGLVEMGALGVSKATTLAAYCAEIGVKSGEVVGRVGPTRWPTRTRRCSPLSNAGRRATTTTVSR